MLKSNYSQFVSHVNGEIMEKPNAEILEYYIFKHKVKLYTLRPF